ncbi:uncharacterized protein LOC131682394 [Topomyia yanbarensis]|uniref:uncharacterized protein LOC131682394 n=1 Tax=Topomyia yanbarensis TaxID=2498891 RepID=UPI00273B0740|nr:uncharacterized protein LOC131682394 [Topomyia yanbarensis]
MNFLTATQRTPPCLKGFIHNINAIRLLWRIVHEEYGFTHLCMNKVCQDALENTFAAVRRSCGCNDTPTSHQFGIAVKYCSVRGTLEKIYGSNCEPDQTSNLLDVEENDKLPESFVESEKDPLTLNRSCVTHSFEPLDFDSEMPDIPETNALVYIIGYATSKLSHKNCKQNMNLAHNSIQTLNVNYTYCKLKHFLNASGFNFPNHTTLEIGIILLFAFKQKFYQFLGESRYKVRNRLKEYVKYEDYKLILCQVCFDKFTSCVLNTLIKGQMSKMMHNFNKKRYISRRKRNGKARRMGLAGRVTKAKKCTTGATIYSKKTQRA